MLQPWLRRAGSKLRGSSGRAAKFSRAIFADWGNTKFRIYSPESIT